MSSHSAGMRRSMTAIIWSLAAWVLIMQLYATLFPPNPSPAYIQIGDSQHHPVDRRHSYYMASRNRGRIRQKRKKRFSSVEDFLNVTSPRRHLFFPDKALAVDPLKCLDSEKNFFYPGREWHDTNGRPIQAHGGGILYVRETETFYWYGENKDGRTYRPHKRALARVDVKGINCYSSRDLWSWRNEGIVLAAEMDNKLHDLHVKKVLERPKVIYNRATNKFVMWMHVDDANYSKAAVGVAVSSSPVGPFHYIRSFQPHGHDSRDMTIFQDDDGQAYLIYSSSYNSELHIGVLTPDYLGLTMTMKRMMVGESREAPSLFKHRGLYYMVTSGCTGWLPNRALVHSAESVMGPWELIGDPCIAVNEEFRGRTFFSQGSFVLPLPGLPDVFLFMGDRWNPFDLRDSRYVWLPLIVDPPMADDGGSDSDDGEPLNTFVFPLWPRVTIHWHKKWKLPEGWDTIIHT